MKKLFLSFAFLALGCCWFSSCQDEDVVSENAVMRDYETDVQLLSKFVDVNRSTGEYFINENKKVTAMSYLTDEDWQELQKVNPVNYRRYEKELTELNRELANYANNPEISKIVYSTYGNEPYIRDLNNDCSIQIEKVKNNTPSSRARYQTLTFMQGGSPAYASFKAGSKINSEVRINCNGPYLCELKCNTKGAECTNNHATGIVLSGTNYENNVYNWTSGSASTLWDFTGIGRTLPFGAYAQVEFTD